METFGARLFRLRTERGWSQSLLAQKLLLKRNHVWKYETDKGKPSFDKLIDLAIALDVSLDYLMMGNEYEASSPSSRARPADDSARCLMA